jgi:hypothetical protein
MLGSIIKRSITLCFLYQNKDENKHTSLVSYGSETWSLTARAAYRIKLLEKRMLRGLLVQFVRKVAVHLGYGT